jgi:hypothetical protein
MDNGMTIRTACQLAAGSSPALCCTNQLGSARRTRLQPLRLGRSSRGQANRSTTYSILSPSAGHP